MGQTRPPDDVFCMDCGPGTALRIDAATRSLLCPACGAQTRRPAHPLFVVAGVSGSGKTAVLEPLRAKLTACEICLLDAPPDVIAARLRDRPSWRGCTEDFIRAQERFAAALRVQISTVFDTNALGITDTADAIADWATTLLADHTPAPDRY